MSGVPEKSREFKQALKAMPRCIGGIDPWIHETPADLAFLALLQLDLYEEGEESDIRTRRQYLAAKRFVSRYSREGRQ